MRHDEVTAKRRIDEQSRLEGLIQNVKMNEDEIAGSVVGQRDEQVTEAEADQTDFFVMQPEEAQDD
jgi:hypothetical protein